MPGRVRVLFLLCVCLLFSSCGTPLVGETDNTTPTPLYVPKSPTPLPTATAADTCPAELRGVASCMTPHSLRVVYGMDSLLRKGFTGKGETVVTIVSFGSPTLQKDMEVFDKMFNLPPVDLQVISPLTDVPEQDPRNDKAGWAMETTLDVQMIHSLAPEAKIVVLTSPVAETEGTFGLPEFRRLEQYVIDHQLGTIVSQSWGASELTLQDEAGKQEMQRWDDLYHQGTTQHRITYLTASGDQGATDYLDDGQKLANVPTTTFPANMPWVTSIGGTFVTRSSSGTSVHESAWTGSGGGFSRNYAMPDYQKTLPSSVQTAFKDKRGVPDVAANGDPGSALAIYFNGQWNLVGGTSASTPLWAGIIAVGQQMAKRSLGFLNPALYRLAASERHPLYFRDITEGDNTNLQAGVKGYKAVPGWDAVTGLGAPNAEELLPALIDATK